MKKQNKIKVSKSFKNEKDLTSDIVMTTAGLFAILIAVVIILVYMNNLFNQDSIKIYKTECHNVSYVARVYSSNFPLTFFEEVCNKTEVNEINIVTEIAKDDGTYHEGISKKDIDKKWLYDNCECIGLDFGKYLGKNRWEDKCIKYKCFNNYEVEIN